jgi:hypothetical protein
MQGRATSASCHCSPWVPSTASDPTAILLPLQDGSEPPLQQEPSYESAFSPEQDREQHAGLARRSSQGLQGRASGAQAAAGQPQDSLQQQPLDPQQPRQHLSSHQLHGAEEHLEGRLGTQGHHSTALSAPSSASSGLEWSGSLDDMMLALYSQGSAELGPGTPSVPRAVVPRLPLLPPLPGAPFLDPTSLPTQRSLGQGAAQQDCEAAGLQPPYELEPAASLGGLSSAGAALQRDGSRGSQALQPGASLDTQLLRRSASQLSAAAAGFRGLAPLGPPQGAALARTASQAAAAAAWLARVAASAGELSCASAAAAPFLQLALQQAPSLAAASSGSRAAASAQEPPRSHAITLDACDPEQRSHKLIMQIASDLASSPVMWPLLSCGPAKAGSLAVMLQQGGSCKARQLAEAVDKLAGQLHRLADTQEQEEQADGPWPSV